MFHAQNLDKSFWMEAVANAVYTQNQYARKCWTLVRLRKCKMGGGLTLHTCVCLDALPMQWCWMKIGISSIQKTPNICFWIIVRELKYICWSDVVLFKHLALDL
jgi:hypothetical protein